MTEAWYDGYRIRPDEVEDQMKDLLAVQQDHPDWFLIWSDSPERHPDAGPGHDSDCNTHSTPALPDGPCSCRGKTDD